MKLRTEMQDTCVHARGICVDDGDVLAEQSKDLQHDAAAAIALMQAVEEMKSYGPITAEALDRRADELMREWTNQSEV